MPNYCDSKVLERTWHDWLMASPTPALENYRTQGLLYSKIIKLSRSDKDNYWGNSQKPARYHALALDNPVYFTSYCGNISGITQIINGRPVKCQLPESNIPPSSTVAGKLVKNGYVAERPIASLWQKMMSDISNICNGIIVKFRIAMEEQRHDVVNEALVQVMKRISDRKLVYTPGRAPVFNLLTTAIYRIICSILNKITKDKHDREKYQNIMAPLVNGQKRLNGRMVTKRIYGSLVALVE